MKHWNNTINRLFCVIFTMILFFVSCGTPGQNNIKTPQAEILKSVKGNKVFSTKVLAPEPELPLPFNASSTQPGTVSLTYQDNASGTTTNSSFSGNAYISIGTDGEISLGVSESGGSLYGGRSIGIKANIPFSTSLKGTVTADIDVSGAPCGYSGSAVSADSSAIVIPTYYFRSGTLTLSVTETGLTANVSGITSDSSAFWMAPWDGSCRIGSHPDHISDGTVSLKVLMALSITPTPTPTENPTVSPSNTPSPSATPTDTIPTPTPSVCSGNGCPTPTPLPTVIPTPIPEPSGPYVTGGAYYPNGRNVDYNAYTFGIKGSPTCQQ